MMPFILKQKKGRNRTMNYKYGKVNNIREYAVVGLNEREREIYEWGKVDGMEIEKNFPIPSSARIFPEQSKDVYGMYFINPTNLEQITFCSHSVTVVVRHRNDVMIGLEGRNGSIIICIDEKHLNGIRLISELQSRGVWFANLSATKLLQYFKMVMSRYAKHIIIPDNIKPGWYQVENQLVFIDYRHEFSSYIPKLLEARYFEEQENLDVYLERDLTNAELLLTMIRLIPVLPNKKNTFGIYIETEEVELVKQFLQIYSSERKNVIYLNQGWKEIKTVIKQLKDEPLFIMLKDIRDKKKQRVIDNMDNIKNLIQNGYFEDLEFHGIIIFLGNTIFPDEMKGNIYYISIPKEDIKINNMSVDIISDFISLIINLIETDQIHASWFDELNKAECQNISVKRNCILNLIKRKYQTQSIEQMIKKIQDIFQKSIEVDKEWHELEGVDEMFIFKFLDMIRNGNVFNMIKRTTGENSSFQEGNYNLFYDKDYILIQEDVFQEIIGSTCNKKFLLEQLASNEWLILSQTVGRKYTQQKSVMINGSTERKYFLVFDRKRLEEVGLELHDQDNNYQCLI